MAGITASPAGAIVVEALIASEGKRGAVRSSNHYALLN